jgi:hypothetical protein
MGSLVENTEASRPDRRQFQGLIVATLAAAVLDVLVTYWALSRHWAAELNPFALHSIGSFGLRRTVALNLAIRGAIVGLLGWIAWSARDVRARTSARWVLTAVLVWWTVVAISNVVVLAVALR